MANISNDFPGLPAPSPRLPLTEGKALELSLMAPLDAFQGFEGGAGLGSIPRRVVVVGQITRDDDPTYQKTVHVTRELDPVTGTYHNRSTLTGPEVELSVEEKTAWDLRSGLSSAGNLTQPGGGGGEVSTKQSFLPFDEGGGIHTEGSIGDISFATDQRMELVPGFTDEGTSVSHQDGHILDPDQQGVVFYRQLTSDLASGITTIAGKFGSLEETGLITLRRPMNRSQAPNPTSLDVERQVGPYRIRQTITVEQTKHVLEADSQHEATQ